MAESKWKTLKFQSSQELVSEFISVDLPCNYEIFQHSLMFIKSLSNAGIEDKLVATEGYGIVVTDEASPFFQDI